MASIDNFEMDENMNYMHAVNYADPREAKEDPLALNKKVSLPNTYFHYSKKRHRHTSIS
jgi:hypothetical protein